MWLLWKNKQYYLKQKPEEESQAHKGDVIVGENQRQGNGSLQVERAQEDGLPSVDVGQRAKHQTSEHDAEKVYRRGDVGQVVTIAHQVKLEKRWLRSSMSKYRFKIPSYKYNGKEDYKKAITYIRILISNLPF